MKVSVRFYTRSGNTEKLAKAIAEAAGVAAENVKQFIKKNKDKTGKIVCFGTSSWLFWSDAQRTSE